MELLDVFTDVDTPPTGDDEDPKTPLVHPPITAHILLLLPNMFAVISYIATNPQYSSLYQNTKYVKNVRKKLPEARQKER